MNKAMNIYTFTQFDCNNTKQIATTYRLNVSPVAVKIRVRFGNLTIANCQTTPIMYSNIQQRLETFRPINLPLCPVPRLYTFVNVTLIVYVHK